MIKQTQNVRQSIRQLPWTLLKSIMRHGGVDRLGLWLYDKTASKDIQPIVICEPRLCHGKET